ncbi:MAG: 3-deoxy-D-manno-octulosonic acid transferase [Synergistaceae bacterium]|nr:3-deoxy-D-manno-octulosonic acid transferase [Synergistaceae bacterium]
MKLLLYRALMFLLKPAARPLLAIRAMRGHESGDRRRRAERLGISGAPRPEGLIFWFNAVSVGESNSIMPIVDFVLKKYPLAHALITTTTVTGAENMAAKLAGRRAVHQFLPLDRRAYAERFFSYWEPVAGFFTDSDFWPNILLSASARRIPLILLNGRVSDRSYARWARHRGVSRRLMGAFVYALAKSADDAKKLSDMGIAKVDCVGNLKYAAPALRRDPDRLEEFSSRAGGRASWVASVTHPGEDEIILRAHKAVREKFPGALLIIAPRHPERGAKILELSRKTGFVSEVESSGARVTENTDVWIADILGGLGLYYAFSDIVFVGGSLLDTLDGHNPMEAARLETAVLSGPNVASFAETYDILKRDGAVIITEDEHELAREVVSLLSDPEKLAETRGRAFRSAEREAGVLERAAEKLGPLLASLTETGRAGKIA